MVIGPSGIQFRELSLSNQAGNFKITRSNTLIVTCRINNKLDFF